MSDYIPTPTMGEILREEFMEPMNLSAYRLAQEIHVPVSRILVGGELLLTHLFVLRSFLAFRTDIFSIFRTTLISAT